MLIFYVSSLFIISFSLGWYDGLSGSFKTSGGWWVTGNCLTSVLEYALKTHNTTFGSLIENMYLKNGYRHIADAGYHYKVCCM